MTALSAQRLAHIKARRAAVFAAPWTHEPYGDKNQNGDPSGGNVFDAHGGYVVADVADCDAEFIAHAPEDIDIVLSAYEAAAAEVERLSASPGDVTDPVRVAAEALHRLAYTGAYVPEDVEPEYWEEATAAVAALRSAGLITDSAEVETLRAQRDAALAIEPQIPAGYIAAAYNDARADFRRALGAPDA